MRRSFLSACSAPAIAIALFLAPAAARAQDITQGWVDWIVHQMVESEDPLVTRPLTTNFVLGAAYLYDDNIFLRPASQTADSVLTVIGRMRAEYGTESLSLTGDAVLSYDRYILEGDESSDEERVFLRLAYAGSSGMIEVSNLFRRESDPIDATFAERVGRIVDDLSSRLTLSFDPGSLELGANLELVHLEESALTVQDNLNVRAHLTTGYELKSGLVLLLQGGALGIHYLIWQSPADVAGWFARAGFRGDLFRNFGVSILAGATGASSVGARSVSETTADVEAHVRWDLTEYLAFLADVSRRIGFGGERTPFQVVNQGVVMLEIGPVTDMYLRARAQADRVDGADGKARDFVSLALTFELRPNEHIALEVGPMYRASDAKFSTLGDYTNLLVHAGLAGLF